MHSSQKKSFCATGLKPDFALNVAVNCLVALALVFVWFCADAGAVTVFGRGVVHPEKGSFVEIRRLALKKALVSAVETIGARHVYPDELEKDSKDNLIYPLEKPEKYILKYSIIAEEELYGSAMVVVEADVDEKKIKDDLASKGHSIRDLGTVPRILIVPIGDEGGAASVWKIEKMLRAEGFSTVPFPGETFGDLPQALLSEWARMLGCHMVLVLNSELAQLNLAGEGFGEETDRFRAEANLAGWLLDARTDEVLSIAQVLGEGEADDPTVAADTAFADAGTWLYHPLVQPLFLSDWSLKDNSRTVLLTVSRLDSPLALERIEASLKSGSEFTEVSLWEVGRRQAVWKLTVLDTGLDDRTVLAALTTEGGELVWEDVEGPEGVAFEHDGDNLPVEWRAVWESN